MASGQGFSPRDVQRLPDSSLDRPFLPRRLVHDHASPLQVVSILYRQAPKAITAAVIGRIQKTPGHKDLSTTQICTHIVDEQLEAALKSFRQATALAQMIDERLPLTQRLLGEIRDQVSSPVFLGLEDTPHHACI